MPPTVLGTQGAGRFQEATLMFSLTCDQATDIASNRDISPGSKLEYPFQVDFQWEILFCHFSLPVTGAAQILPKRLFKRPA